MNTLYRETDYNEGNDPAMKKRIVFKITDYIERDLAWEESECSKLGIDFDYYRLKTAPPDEIVRHVHDADILLVNMAKFPAEVIDALKNVRVILRHGIGYDNVDVAAATRNGILFANEATASSEDVAEQAIMLMFEAYRKKNIQNRMLRTWTETGKWSSEPIAPLYRMAGKTLGIIGCGNIGSKVLRKMSAMGMHILVCDPYLSQERLNELGIIHTPLGELLERSDIVTIHVPVTGETRGMIDARTLSLMKKTAVLVNTSRGPVIRTDDLIAALKNGTIAGAGLDVCEPEPPPPDSDLFSLDTVVMSPHIAWYSEEGGWDIRYMIMDDVRAFLAGKPPRYVVNPEVYQSPLLRMNIQE
ncbi:C-terminal binding protein [bacterium]|nr:C-terminal binding protein [bacterium]